MDAREVAAELAWPALSVSYRSVRKSKVKQKGTTELPRFVVGALATAYGSVANGATVQITFANNVVSSVTGTTNFMSDLTGDGTVDVLGAAGPGYAILRTFSNGNIGVADVTGQPFFASLFRAYVNVGGVVIQDLHEESASTRGLVAVSFTDWRVNSGSQTNGWLDLSASSATLGQAVSIHRLIFDDGRPTAPTGLTWESTVIPEWQVSAVPEPGSNLALLALGAGGLTLRRRLKRAA